MVGAPTSSLSSVSPTLTRPASDCTTTTLPSAATALSPPYMQIISSGKPRTFISPLSATAPSPALSHPHLRAPPAGEGWVGWGQGAAQATQIARLGRGCEGATHVRYGARASWTGCHQGGAGRHAASFCAGRHLSPQCSRPMPEPQLGRLRGPPSVSDRGVAGCFRGQLPVRATAVGGQGGASVCRPQPVYPCAFRPFRSGG